MKHILSYLKPFRKRLVLGFFIKAIATLSELMIPYFLSYIIDYVIVSQRVGDIVRYGLVMMLCSLIACVGNITANRLSVGLTADFSKKMRSDLFRKTISLSARDRDRFTIPSLESRITTDTYNVHDFISTIQTRGVRAPILLFGGIAITVFMDRALVLVMIATLPFIFCTVYFISKMGVPLYSRVQQSVDAMVRVVREDTQGIRVIKALSKNRYENQRYDVVNRELSKREKKAGTVMGVVNPVMTMLMNLGIAGVVSYAAIRVSEGTSSTATVLAFMQYFTLISNAMMALSRLFVMYTKCSASARRISEVLLTPDRYYITNDDSPLDKDTVLTMKGVTFSYLGKRNDLVVDDLVLKKGQNLGIIGSTGSGKSTLIRLLLRSYDTDGGEIRLYGKNITSFSRSDLSDIFGVVLQNDFIYADTVEENICFGRDLTREAIEEAAKIAQAHDFISSFPDGYQHPLSTNGTNVSGGQRQRILIARAIADQPEILILDDASSALDYKTDFLLRQALNEKLRDTTVITVAQRVSSVKNCDVILVLEDGAVIGKGTHDELMENCPVYREISDSQMGGAIID